MSVVKRAKHAVYDLKYHFVWIPKYRKLVLTGLSTVSMCCPCGQIGGGQDGNIYWAGNGDRYTGDNEPDMHMLRITPSGEVTLLSQNLPMDPADVAGDPTSSDLYVSSGCGVYRVFKASSAVFRVDAEGRVLSDGALHASGFVAGAADVAEWVAVSELVEPGDVIELDPNASTTYHLSQAACSSLVSGVISTAPGFVLGSSLATEDSGLPTGTYLRLSASYLSR